MNQHAHILQVALDAARTAGDTIKMRRTETREIKSKGLRDIVTDADLAANRAIQDILKKEFPTHAILSEEDAHPELHLRRSESLWIIDPLDGTTNYSRGYPVYSVSIALVERGHPQVGVVYDPLRDECYYATRGEGAFLNGAKIHPSRISKIEDTVIGTELPRDQSLRERGMHMFSELAGLSMSARLGGSAALSLCYVAAGRLDAYFHLDLHTWDVAAGILIAREAGARVTHLDGRAATIQGGTYLLASRQFFPAFIRTIKHLGI